MARGQKHFERHEGVRAKRATRRFALATGGTVLTLITLFAVAPSAASAATSSGVKVMQFNICGDVCLQGASPTTIESNKISSFNPAVIILEEVCHSQANTIAGSTYNVYWYQKQTGTYCDPGNAILTKRALTNTSTVGMPVANWNANTSSYDYTGVEDILSCGRTSVLNDSGLTAIPLEVCVTHLDNDPNTKTNDVELNGATSGVGTRSAYLRGSSSWEGAAAYADDQANGAALVFGGDFNIAPDDNSGFSSDPKPMYPSFNNVESYGTTNTGQWNREIDHSWANRTSDAATHGTEKIDYLFFKQGYSVSPVMGSGSPYDTSGGSDHKMLYGSVDLTN
jgi:endonuclease/exonuclease/phosphatase family metal-dependent hydrolase